tara:strand:- start:2451 stop:4148 length:1698 start_codon:yes stop_codon:yes gene_type:complete
MRPWTGPTLDGYEGINEGSPRLEPVYSPGKTKFLDTTKNNSAKSYESKAFHNGAYNAVVLKVTRAEWSLNPLSYIPYTDAGTVYTVTARIPGLHSHLPDPFKFPNSDVIIDLYPTFTGELKEKPKVGAIMTVMFIDDNDRFRKYGNGRILTVRGTPVNGLYDGKKDGSFLAPTTQADRNRNAPGLAAVACDFLDFNSPRNPQPPPLVPIPPNDKSTKEENPQRVGGSYKDRKTVLSEREAALSALEPLPSVLENYDENLRKNLKIASMEPLYTGAKDLTLMGVKYVAGEKSRVSTAAEWVLTTPEAVINKVSDEIDSNNPYRQEAIRTKVNDEMRGGFTYKDTFNEGFTKPPPDCKSIASVAEYNAAVAEYAVAGDQDEYPRWPVTVGGYDVATKQATAGLWKGQGGTQNLLGGITSLMQSKRSTTIGGKTKTRNHNGIDIATVVGTPILATLEGEVVFAKNTTTDGGATVVIQHDVGGKRIWSGYCHLSAILCEEGKKVYQGTCIGLTGGAKGAWGSGRSGGPHLHFQIALKRGSRAISSYYNPMEFLGTKISEIAKLPPGFMD